MALILIENRNRTEKEILSSKQCRFSGFNWVLIKRAFCLHRLIAKPKLGLQCFPATVRSFR